jgi:ABC-type antimicrobial peptide transport system permease subunit
MKIPLRQGRDFTEADNERAGRVVIIDEALQQRFWPNDSPLGSRLLITFGGDGQPLEFEVVGVAGNVKHVSLNEGLTATLYAPLYQMPQSVVTSFVANVNIVVGSALDARTLTTAVQREFRSVDPEAPASNVRTMEQFRAASVAARRFNLLLLTVFAGVALLLAAAGLYAVVAHSVAERAHEIAIRMALGAQPSRVLGLVVGQGLKLTAFGLLLGLGGALALTRLMASLLFGVSATDPVTFTGVVALLTGVALLAAYLPARRAASADPIVALCGE